MSGKVIKQSYVINASANKVWGALTDPKMIEGWGGGPAEMGDKVGTEFKLWGGDIHGKNIEVIKNKKLVQEWFSGNWPKPSIVTFELDESDGKTTLDLTHTDVPDDEIDDISEGWKDYYLRPLTEYVENHLA